ncbi:MAG: hypothetical protein ACREE2_12790 [Stellaceae bacterium]
MAIPRSALFFLRLIGAAIICCDGITHQTKTPWKIDQPTAQHLAAEAVYGGVKYLGFFDYDSDVTDNFTPPFIVFDGLSKSPAEGSFGFFAVNPWTGDVWSLWDCNRLSTPALRKSQAAIRRRFHRAHTNQYGRLRRLKPERIVED